MPTAVFKYLYRDAGNYKAFGSVTLRGASSDADLKQIRASFSGDGLFIAEQIGVPSLYEQLYLWSGGPTSSDHCWHEFMDVLLVDEAEIGDQTWLDVTASEFVDRVASVGTWEEDLSPHFSPRPLTH